MGFLTHSHPWSRPRGKPQFLLKFNSNVLALFNVFFLCASYSEKIWKHCHLQAVNWTIFGFFYFNVGMKQPLQKQKQYTAFEADTQSSLWWQHVRPPTMSTLLVSSEIVIKTTSDTRVSPQKHCWLLDKLDLRLIRSRGTNKMNPESRLRANQTQILCEHAPDRK